MPKFYVALSVTPWPDIQVNGKHVSVGAVLPNSRGIMPVYTSLEALQFDYPTAEHFEIELHEVVSQARCVRLPLDDLEGGAKPPV
jgi:hypothetical protein